MTTGAEPYVEETRTTLPKKKICHRNYLFFLISIRCLLLHPFSHAIFSHLLLAPFEVSALPVAYKITVLMELTARQSSIEETGCNIAQSFHVSMHKQKYMYMYIFIYACVCMH